MKLFEIHIDVQALKDLAELLRIPIKAVPKFLNEPVSVLELGTRTSNALHYVLEIETIKDLVQKTPKQILSTPNMGKRCLQEIRETLDRHGLWLGMKFI